MGSRYVFPVNLTYLSLDENNQIQKNTKATFRQWPATQRGVYATEVVFDHAGPWGLLAQVVDEDGEVAYAQSGIMVSEESASPGIGRPAVASVNKTVESESDLSKLSSSASPDRDLYMMTIAEAIASGQPTIVVFATPAFCQTATCGPQVEILTDIKARHRSDANFIHVEVYDNPNEMLGDITVVV